MKNINVNNMFRALQIELVKCHQIKKELEVYF